MKWAGHVSCMEEERIVLSVLVGGSEKKEEAWNAET
jgi:hypothetical protein